MSIYERNGERGPKQGRPDVTVTVAVMPTFIMCVFAVRRSDVIEESAQIAESTAFIFDGCQRAGG